MIRSRGATLVFALARQLARREALEKRPPADRMSGTSDPSCDRDADDELEGTNEVGHGTDG